ncbi:nickel pincer cofactor biosynthesis protein LarC [Altericista sp. CCNU0014]|uniref:nickel pincer cofactor biosynthesis protein LarC n=1 Tax=Altericista sp. CCNU0014 TaxID=3082949 RepID=UPI00384CAF5F
MARIAYFDCPSGIAGNMCLGALLDVGVPLSHLEVSLAQLHLADEYKISVEPAYRQGQRGTYVRVEVVESHPHHPPHRHLPEIEASIRQTQLPERVKTWSSDIFRTLAIAEGAVHGIPPESVHFHEVGATDAIVDIVGTCIGLDWLGVERVFCSALPTGGGTVRAAHGLLPVPVPAVLQLATARQMPLYDNGIQKELVTPTGAAIVATLAQTFGPVPALALERVGLGAGSRDLPIPNLLRLWLGEDCTTNVPPTPRETIALLETQLDDINPQVVGYLYDLLLAVGAVEVFTQAIGMKKSRPGLLLSVLCPPALIETCEAILFRETTTLGIRRSLQQRAILDRQIERVETPLGQIQVKVARYHNRVVNVQPEYEDCVRLAQQHGKPLKDIQQMAFRHWDGSST